MSILGLNLMFEVKASKSKFWYNMYIYHKWDCWELRNIRYEMGFLKMLLKKIGNGGTENPCLLDAISYRILGSQSWVSNSVRGDIIHYGRDIVQFFFLYLFLFPVKKNLMFHYLTDDIGNYLHQSLIIEVHVHI